MTKQAAAAVINGSGRGPIIVGRCSTLVVIHFSTPVDSNAKALGDGEHARALPPEWLELVRWYCHDLGANGDSRGSVTVLLPQSYMAAARERSSCWTNARAVGYTCGELHSLEIDSRHGDVWVVNGSKAPIIGWDDVGAAADRRACDVLVLDVLDSAGSQDCSVSLRVDEQGRVLAASRHYANSPASAERWSGTASAVVCAAQHARAVLSHVALYGWGLESIGLLTRRFHVGWSAVTSGALSRASTNGSHAGQAVADGGSAPLARPLRPNSSIVPTVDSEQAVIPEHVNGRNGRTRPAGISIAPEVGNHHASSEGRGGTSPPRLMQTTGTRAENEPGARSWASEALFGHGNTYRFFKRMTDIVVSALTLIVLSPALVVVAALVKLTSSGPVLFAHVRQGLKGKEFGCLKFRTMCEGAEAMQHRLRGENEVDGPQFKISEDPRLTRLGTWLRRYNVDELPQFINVLRGDMSLVGPRPSPDAENQYCPEWRRARLSERPGITGLWQVMRARKHRDSDFQEWIYYDLEYARHRSLWLDWQILAHTPFAMFAPRMLDRLARRLRRRGICVHSAEFSRALPSPSDPLSGETGKPNAQTAGLTRNL